MALDLVCAGDDTPRMIARLSSQEKQTEGHSIH